MNSADRLSSVFFIVLSVGICLASLTLRAGSLEAPGPMIFPLLLGLCLLALSVALFLKTRSLPQAGLLALFPREERWSVIGIMGCFFLFALIFEFLGFVISVFVLMLLLMKVIGGNTIRKAVLYSSIITLSTYFIFVTMLGVRLPKGFLGF